MKKILFVLPNLHGGGAEKVMANLALNINKKIFDVKFLVFNNSNQRYLKDKKIKIINLNEKSISSGILNFLKVVNKIKPNVLISSVSHLNLMIATIKPLLPNKTIFISRESNFISSSIHFQKNKKLMQIMYKKFYNNIDLCLVFSKKHKIDILKNTNLDRKKVKIFENSINYKEIIANSKKKIDLKYNKYFKKDFIKYVFVGSLSYQKGLDIFIKSLIKLKKKNYVFNIVGEGSEKNNLKKLIHKNNLNNNINFIPFQKNPYPFIKLSDIFIAFSRFEGMSNVILETLALDKTIFYLKNNSASNEILTKIENSKLFKNKRINQISEEIANYRYKRNAKSNKNFLKKYDIKIKIKIFEKIINNEIQKK